MNFELNEVKGGNKGNYFVDDIDYCFVYVIIERFR